MGEAHARGMEGGWNSSEVWPVPVPDCLLNGMNATETHNIFGGNHMLQQQFRPRFQPPMHFTSSHLIPIPGSINVNIPIPSHSMIENSGQVQVDTGSGPSLSVDDNDQAGISQDIRMDERDVLEDTDEVSEDDDDEEVDDEEMSVQMPHAQDVGQLSMSHQMSDEGLVQVQCQQVPGAIQVQDSLVHQQQPNMIPMNEAHCHHQKLSMNGSDMTVHQHPLQPQPAHGPAMDQIFGQQADAFDAEQDQDGSNDPNSGFSVYGKMYFEGRVVLHLKQSGDSDLGIVGGGGGGMGFSSCGVPEPQKPHLHGCAFCRLRSPQDTLRSQKEAHRHTVKGVLFTFEDCIIVELYPEQINGPISNPSGQKPTNSQAKPESLSNQPVTISEYMTPTTMALPDVPQRTSEKNLADPNQMNFNPIGSQQQSLAPASIPTSGPKGVQPNAPEEHHSWWDEFESEGEDDLKEPEDTTEEEESNQPSDYHHSASYLRPSNEDEDEEQEDEGHSGEGEYSSLSYKCNECSGVFHSSIQLNTHPCHTIDSITNFPSSCSSASANELCPTGNLIASPNIEELVLSPSNTTNIAHLDDGNIKCTGGKEIKLISPVPPGEESCQGSRSKPSSSNLPDTTKKKANNNNNPTVKKKRKFPCPSCDNIFPLKKNLKTHLEVEHSEGNPYRCESCSLQLTDESQIDKHTCSVTSQRRLKRLQISKNGTLPVPVEEPSRSPQVFEIVEYPELQTSTQLDLSKQDLRKNNKDLNHRESKNKRRKEGEKTEDFKRKLNNQKMKVEVFERKQVYTEEEQETPLVRLKPKKRKAPGISNNSKYHFKKATLEMKTRKSFKFSSRKPFSCDICGKGFTMQLRLEKHRHSHGTEKSSQCEKCGKRFARKDKLMRHMFVHNEEKMFSCDICDKRFSRRDKLTDHLRSHGGPEEIHKCPMCKKEFLRPDILKQHEKLHTMANKHQCPECLRFVTGKDRLEQHMARHEEAKAQGQTLLCPLCTKAFIQRQSLKAHIKRFHPTAHKSILSALDFPPTKESDRDHEVEGTEESSGSSSKEATSQRYSCDECPFPKYFSAIAAFTRHVRHHHQKSPRTEERERPRPKHHNHKSTTRKVNRRNRRTCQEEAESSKTPETREDPQESEDPNLACLFTSAASQIVSPSPQSPVATCHSPNLTCIEPVPAHSGLTVQHPSTQSIQHFSPRRQLLHDLQLASSVQPSHHPLSLSVSPSVVVSSHQQNGILGLSSHGLHHHLLQHSHGHGHSLQMGQSYPHPAISHPLGQQVSMSTIHHHLNVNMANVNMTSQPSLCGNPYLVYQHSHYPYQ